MSQSAASPDGDRGVSAPPDRAFGVDRLDALDEASRAWIKLCLAEGLGPVGRERLIARFGGPVDVLRADRSALQGVTGIGPKTAAAIMAARRLDLEELTHQCRLAGVGMIWPERAEYPRRLTEVPAPPGLLFVAGNLLSRDELAVAIVGTRHASRYGERQAARFAEVLADTGVTIVSGLARGIDAAAHRGALAGGGRTIAVLGSGHGRLYPSCHRELADSIAAQGAVMSEYPPRRPPLSSTFPQRNRIVSGLALATLVIEAGARSGALITARHAMEQNREVLVLPGPVEKGAFRGSHRLIRDGALLVETPSDVLEALGPLPVPAEGESGDVRAPAELLLSEQERAILSEIGTRPTPIDQVVARSGLPVQRVLSTLSMLEMRHLIERVSGQFVARR